MLPSISHVVPGHFYGLKEEVEEEGESKECSKRSTGTGLFLVLQVDSPLMEGCIIYMYINKV